MGCQSKNIASVRFDPKLLIYQQLYILCNSACCWVVSHILPWTATWLLHSPLYSIFRTLCAGVQSGELPRSYRRSSEVWRWELVMWQLFIHFKYYIAIYYSDMYMYTVLFLKDETILLTLISLDTWNSCSFAESAQRWHGLWSGCLHCLLWCDHQLPRGKQQQEQDVLVLHDWSDLHSHSK